METPKHKDFKASGLLLSRGPGQGVTVAVIRDQAEILKLKDFKASGLLVSRCPGQRVSGNKGTSGNP